MCQCVCVSMNAATTKHHWATTLRETFPKKKQTGSHVCAQCGQNCASASKLTTHSRTRMRNPLCACPAGFAQAGHLTTWGEEPFVCGTCGKGFADSSHLVAHAQTHPGENPFVCDVWQGLCGGR